MVGVGLDLVTKVFFVTLGGKCLGRVTLEDLAESGEWRKGQASAGRQPGNRSSSCRSQSSSRSQALWLPAAGAGSRMMWVVTLTPDYSPMHVSLCTPDHACLSEDLRAYRPVISLAR